MEIESCAMFLVGSILSCCAIAVIAVTVLFLNHLFSRYWKTVVLFKHYSFDLDGAKLTDPDHPVNSNTSNTVVVTHE